MSLNVEKKNIENVVISVYTLLHEIFRDMLISRFWGSYISQHLNFAIFRKFCVLSHLNFAFWVIYDPRDMIFFADKVI